MQKEKEAFAKSADAVRNMNDVLKTLQFIQIFVKRPQLKSWGFLVL